MNIQAWFPLGLTGLISLKSKGLSRVFSNTTIPRWQRSCLPMREAWDAGLISGLGRSLGAGHGNSLQYFCLETYMDRGAWWSTVHGGTKSWTQPKWLRMHTQSKDKWRWKVAPDFLWCKWGRQDLNPGSGTWHQQAIWPHRALGISFLLAFCTVSQSKVFNLKSHSFKISQNFFPKPSPQWLVMLILSPPFVLGLFLLAMFCVKQCGILASWALYH